MVRRQLWIANSALVGLLILSMGTYLLIKQEVPVHRARKRRQNTLPVAAPAMIVNVEKIYQNDLFGTYTPTPEKGPQAKNLVTPIPTFKAPPSSTAPPLPKADFLAPLDVKIKGIILSPDQSKSIVMLADQTGKESVYYVGDKVHDGQIMKLTKNKMVVLRNNGQLETFHLRNQDKLAPGLSSWDAAVKKIDDNLYHLDPLEITKGVSSVGEVIELLDLGEAHEGSVVTGVEVGSINHHPLGAKLGFAKGDVITAVNDITATDSKQRIKIFDAIAALPMGSHIQVKLVRNGQEKVISYLLKHLEKPSPFGNPVTKQTTNDEKEDELFKLSKNAQRQQSRRRFEHVHRTNEQHDQAVSEMRQRLLSNMKDRSRNRRVW